MNRRYVPLCLGLMLALGAAGDVEAEELRIATLAPADSQWMREMAAGGERIRELTGGRVTLRFRAGGIAGSDEQVLRKIRISDLHGGAFTAGGLASLYPGLNTYGIPLIFESLDEVDYVRSRLDARIAAGLEQAGFVSFGFSEGGFSNLMSNVPVSHVDDLRRQKIWVPDNDPIAHQVLDALRLAPVPLELSDALLGLRRGLVDVVAASPVAALVLQWHTEVKYRTDLPLSYSMGVFAIPSDVFYGLAESDQVVVRSVLTEVMATIDSTSRDDNAEARRIMESMGIETVPVNRADVESWRRIIEEQYPELRRHRDIDVELFDAMLALLDEFRATH
ncbi:MAG TPA: TRAP transporter substrate-binding protein DctP [Gammaproteobacteria bacterium]|nr:TRAP transporter substrate-binding protein DctP [Gammaproteobacteria bacterium]